MQPKAPDFDWRDYVENYKITNTEGLSKKRIKELEEYIANFADLKTGKLI